jgi:hypothetical protein
MNLSPRRLLLAASLVATFATGCFGMMPPPGARVAAPGLAPVAAPAPAPAFASPAAQSNNCITETRCNWNSDCADGGHCNAAAGLCFDPDPVASTVLTCHLNACRWDSDCPSSWSCNSATSHCQLR